jgi:diguanylate cyclase (GGDEF)-like protein/PAS domain S-box-containing protein
MLFLNAAGRRLFGLPESPGQAWDPENGWNVRGLPSDTQSLESTVRRFQPPEEARRMIEQVGPVALRDGIWEGESRVLDARGREVPVSQAILVTRDAQGRMQQLSTIVRDLSRQKAVERALRESETRFRQMAESVNEIFWLSDPDEVLYINPAYERIMGRSRQEAYESPDALLDAVHPDDRQRVSEEMKGVGSRQRTIDMTFRVVQADGDTRWVRMRRYPVADAEGRGDRVAGTVVDVTELKRVELELERANALLEHQALYDALTNVANRRQFDILLDREVARVDRYGGSFALIMFDLDHFKSVNDEHGHAVGDQVLEATARVIEDRLRKSDVLGRWGGEEFMVLMSDTDLDDAVQAAEAMRQRVASYRYPGVGPVTISLGVAAYHPGGSRTDLLRDVDESMYRAKREGRNRIVASR